MAIPARRTSTSPSSTQWSQHRHEQSLPDSNRDTKERTMGAEMWQAYAQMVACVETAASRLNARHGDDMAPLALPCPFNRERFCLSSRQLANLRRRRSPWVCVPLNVLSPPIFANQDSMLGRSEKHPWGLSKSLSPHLRQQLSRNNKMKRASIGSMQGWDPSSSRKRTPGMSSLSSSGFKIVGRPINCQHGICQRIALKMWASRCDPFDFSRFTRVCPAKRNSHSAAKRNHLQNPYRQLCDFPPQQSHHLMHGPRHARHLIFTRGEHSDDLGARVHPL